MTVYNTASADPVATLPAAERQHHTTPARRATPQAASMQQLFEHAGIRDELAALERLLLERSASRVPAIAEAGAYTIRAGGKRLRAAMVLLAARLGRPNAAHAQHAAAAVELIHAASLVHDDLVDQADRRRGQTTVHRRWDNDTALMLGDYFFALAAAEMARCADQRIIRFYAQAVQTIVTGELHPVTDATPYETALRQYLTKTGAKTAALFEAGCKAGMVVAGGSGEDIDALGRYGYHMGLAFQMVDDMLDFTGDERTLGKPAGNDLRQGTITLPLIHAITNGGSAWLHDIASAPAGSLTDAQVARAIDEVIAQGGIRATQAAAEADARRALASLERFAPGPARQALTDLARFVLARQT
jgi:heptaprenyl diphosphate synthase/octaprenyl-diphosphate synthase